MNSYDLELFRLVAEQGSFNRVKQIENMDWASLVRKMEAIEAEMGIKLFTRTTHGIRLTPAGEAMYHESQPLLDQCDRLLAKVRSAVSDKRPRLVVGTTPLCQGAEITRMWEILKQSFPDHILILHTYGLTDEERIRIYEDLGLKVDYLACWNVRKGFPNRYAFRELFRVELAAGVPASSPLAGRACIRPADLAGRAIVMPDPAIYTGLADYYEWMRRHIPKLEIRMCQEAGDELLNRAVCENIPALIPATWKGVHPEVTPIPMERFGKEPMTIPFGVRCEKRQEHLLPPS